MTSDVPLQVATLGSREVALLREVDQRVNEVEEASSGLVAGPCADLRRAVLHVAMAGLHAADPGSATRRLVNYQPDTDTLCVGDHAYRLEAGSRVWVVGAGKASYRIAEALEEILGDRISGGVVSVRDPGLSSLPHIRILCTDHPLPSTRSVAAAEQILELASEAGPDDLVLTCFTGGSSALASLPPAGVSVSDKRLLHELLLSSGLAITEVNVVRKAVSDVKGGRVALAAAPATVVNLTVSDVAGSALDAVTDPSVQDSGTAADARTILAASGLWDRLPASVRSHLERDLPTPTLARDPQTMVLADGALTVTAMTEAARALGFATVSAVDEFEGEADEVGPRLARRLLDDLGGSRRAPVMLLGCGGESVVAVTKPAVFGQGGPNQHAALRAAETLQGRRAAALFIDTDGSDGGTELAGGLVDGWTMHLAELRGIDVAAHLDNRSSTTACVGLDAAIRTGHTGTNVNDLCVLVAEPGAVR